jgi:hypothetical protein
MIIAIVCNHVEHHEAEHREDLAMIAGQLLSGRHDRSVIERRHAMVAEQVDV